MGGFIQCERKNKSVCKSLCGREKGSLRCSEGRKQQPQFVNANSAQLSMHPLLKRKTVCVCVCVCVWREESMEMLMRHSKDMRLWISGISTEGVSVEHAEENAFILMKLYTKSVYFLFSHWCYTKMKWSLFYHLNVDLEKQGKIWIQWCSSTSFI